MDDHTRILIAFYNVDGNCCSTYDLTGDSVLLERVPLHNDDMAWRALARWIIVNRPNALADALGDVAALDP